MLRALLNRKKIRKLPEVSDIRLAKERDFIEKSKVHLEGLEDIRKTKLTIYKWRKRMAIPVAVILTPVLGYLDYFLLFLQSGDDRGAGITVVALGALYTWVTHPRRQYAKAYKLHILPDLAKLFGDFSYDLKGQVARHKMQPSKILPKYDRCDSEDYFSGTYKGVDIEFSEVDFKQRRRSKNRTRYVSVFKGLVIMLDMKTKKFYGHTLLDRDKGKIGEWFKQKSSKLKRANLVDPEFEKIFDVYTNDQVEARYLIDPVMIERLKGLQMEYGGESITAAFFDSKMLILIQSDHNYFEPAALEIPATDPRSILSMKKEIGEILSLIDRLDLYDPQKVYEERNIALDDIESGAV
ncbi:MAG: hypothetical protein COA45_09120 [Zetaproteobacteria bacterium]|nr:MAG: hypothetical protein COA45_09120 [Zetaproteobacteria bacterium]